MRFLLALCFLIGFNAHGKTFRGMVQFAKGTAELAESKAPLKFQSLLFTGDQLIIDEDSYVKVITQEKCLFVAYGPAQVTAAESSPLWKGVGTFRVICPVDSRQQYEFNNQILHMSPESEVLVTENQALLLRGKVQLGQKDLTIKGLYQSSQNLWELESLKPEKIYALNSQFAPPKESQRVDRPRPPKTSRWIASHFEGIGQLAHEESLFDQDDIDVYGERLSFHYQWGGGALIGSFEHFEAEDPDHFDCRDNCNFNFVNQSDPNRDNRTEGFVLSLGWRPHFKKNWSWYWKLAMGEFKHRINSHFDDVSCNGNFCNYNRRESHYVLGAIVGVDYLWEFAGWWDWLGIYVSAEAAIYRTLSHNGTDFDQCNNSFGSCENPYPSSEVDTTSNYDIIGLNISLGPFLRF